MKKTKLPKKNEQENCKQYAYVGRQPIYNQHLVVKAYELLYRNSDANWADVSDGNQTTSQVILNTLVEIGLHQLAGDSKAFINLTQDFVTGKHPLPFDNNQIVLEVLEDVEGNQEVIDGIM